MNDIATNEQVVQFYLKVALGKHYALLENSKNEDDIIKASLRIAWIAAFSHVGYNVAKDMDKYTSDNFGKKYDEFIIKNIIGNAEFICIFKNYAIAKNTKERIDILNEKNDYLKNLFGKVKKDKCLTFGIFQKLFNMAIKWLYCFEVHKAAL